MAGESFSFQVKGFLRRRVLISRLEDQAPVAVLSRLGSGGTLDFADGRTQPFVWRKPRALSNEHLWLDSAGQMVAHVHPSNWSFNVKISFESAASQAPELGLLALLAGFLAVIANQDAAVAGTVAATS